MPRHAKQLTHNRSPSSLTLMCNVAQPESASMIPTNAHPVPTQDPIPAAQLQLTRPVHHLHPFDAFSHAHQHSKSPPPSLNQTPTPLHPSTTLPTLPPPPQNPNHCLQPSTIEWLHPPNLHYSPHLIHTSSNHIPTPQYTIPVFQS